MQWFRKNQKKLLGVFVVALMAAWGIGPAISVFSTRSGEKPVGTIFGEEISQKEFNEAVIRWSRLFLQQSKAPVVETVWKQLILVREAERVGLKVSDGEVLEGIRKMSAALFEGAMHIPLGQIIAVLCNNFGLGEAQLLQTLREALLTKKLDYFIRDSIKISSEEAWQKYSMENEQAKVEYIALKTKDIAGYMEVSEEEIQSFYNEYRDNFPNVFEGVPGYKEQEKAKIEYIIAKYDDFKEGIAVSEGEIRKYYEDNKETRYKIIEEAQPDAHQSVPHTHDVGYKPFIEVKEEINSTLKRQKSEVLAGELINKADDQITTELGKTERINFEELASKFALTYYITTYFEAKDASKIIRGTDKVSRMAFVREKFDPTPPYDSSDGRFIFQVIDKKPPGAQPLAEIRSTVEKNLKEEKALRRMRELAEKHIDKLMKDGTFDEGVKILEAELLEIVKQGAAADNPDSETQKVTIEHSETDYFSRPTYWDDRPSRHIPALQADRPNVASKAFGIEKGEVAIVVEERGEKTCYIISLVEKKELDRSKFEEGKDEILKKYLAEKQQAFITQWIDSLSQRASLQARYSM